ncbi:hypothetical protein SUGI_0019050 [Cryptomeria japonica]|nr:hypothetical protein SUGI_0019050 [Cryptomeria japonica]
MNIRLVESNDYVGKGMAGGEIVIVPSENVGFVLEDLNIVKGKVGEHFVRNSLVEVVVEGTGDHCYECMTGGLAYLLDKDDTLI